MYCEFTCTLTFVAFCLYFSEFLQSLLNVLVYYSSTLKVECCAVCKEVLQSPQLNEAKYPNVSYKLNETLFFPEIVLLPLTGVY